jgi:hypothetical protein
VYTRSHKNTSQLTIRELRRDGKLKIIEIGRKHFTTEAALKDMLAASTLTPRPQCRDQARVSDFTSARVAETAEKSISSSVDRAKLAQTAALMSLTELTKSSPNTSRGTTKRRKTSIVPMRSSSQTS